MKKETAWDLGWLAILSFIAFGQVYLFGGGRGAATLHGEVMLAEVLLLITAYSGAFFLNLRVLLPCLLFRNHFTAYMLSLFGVAATLTGLEVLFEYISLTRYHLSPSIYGYIGGDGIWYLQVISSIIPYNISIASTAILVFFRHWKQSHLAIRDWNAQCVRTELERTKSQIDAAALFDTLDRTIAVLQHSSEEAVRLLMELSRSLRIQLYESRKRRPALPGGISRPAFNLFSPVLNFLTAPSRRIARHGTLALLICLLNIHNYDGTAASLALVVILTAILLAPIYVNIYLLVPRLLLKGRIWAYAAALVTVITIIIGGTLLSFSVDKIQIVTNVVKISVFTTGISVIILLQQWVRNEQRVTALQTATHQAELELLQNQVNPHFLFNMLNNIIVQIQDNPIEAQHTLHKLNDLLKYQFQETKQNVRLADDIRFLEDYLNLEKLRRDRFDFSISAEEEVKNLRLPPLLFIPFVENAVKHGNDSKCLSYVYLQFEREGTDKLRFACTNSKPSRRATPERIGGLGLANIHSRLNLLYGNRYRLDITETEKEYHVKLIIQI